MQPVSGVSLTMPPLVIDIGKTKRGPMATASETDVRILDVFFCPRSPLVWGGSPTPLECYSWDEDPTIAGTARTVITPDVSLDVIDDGSLRPYVPAHLRFRDGEIYRCRSFSGTVGACPGARHAARTAGHARSATSCQRLTG